MKEGAIHRAMKETVTEVLDELGVPYKEECGVGHKRVDVVCDLKSNTFIAEELGLLKHYIEDSLKVLKKVTSQLHYILSFIERRRNLSSAPTAKIAIEVGGFNKEREKKLLKELPAIIHIRKSGSIRVIIDRNLAGEMKSSIKWLTGVIGGRIRRKFSLDPKNILSVREVDYSGE